MDNSFTNLDEDKKKDKMKSMAQRINKAMFLSSLIIVGVIIAITCVLMTGYLKNDVKKNVQDFAMMAAAQVDGDVFAAITDENCPEYQEVYDILSPFKASENIKFIYAMVKKDSKLYFLVDTDEYSAADFLEEYEDAPDEMFIPFEGESSCDEDITTDTWGSYISGYAPIFDSAGNVVGMVGVDCDVSSIRSSRRDFITKMLFVAIICLVISTFIAKVPCSKLKKRLDMVNNKLTVIAFNEGNLTKKIDIATGDEFEQLATNLNALLEQTRKIVSNVKNCSGKIHNVALNVDETMDGARMKVENMNSFLQEMGQNIETTVSSLEQIRAMMEEVGLSVNEVTEKSSHGAEVALEIQARSNAMTDNAIESRKKITAQVEEMNQRLEEQLEKAKSVEEIQNFTDDIMSIASQTKMLSFNASIEAARAGEAGKGFAVVAENIGYLAENSGKAAGNIQIVSNGVIEVVEDLSNMSRQMISFINENILTEFVDLTNAGEQYSQDAAKLTDIMEQFKERMAVVDEAVSEIRSAIDLVTDSSVTNNEHVVELTAQSAELNNQMTHTADMSQMNKDQADNLSKVVEKYTV